MLKPLEAGIKITQPVLVESEQTEHGFEVLLSDSREKSLLKGNPLNILTPDGQPHIIRIVPGYTMKLTKKGNWCLDDRILPGWDIILKGNHTLCFKPQSVKTKKG